MAKYGLFPGYLAYMGFQGRFGGDSGCSPWNPWVWPCWPCWYHLGPYWPYPGMAGYGQNRPKTGPKQAYSGPIPDTPDLGGVPGGAQIGPFWGTPDRAQNGPVLGGLWEAQKGVILGVLFGTPF